MFLSISIILPSSVHVFQMQLVTLKVLSPVSSIWQISTIYSNSIYMVNFIHVLSYANGFVSSMVSSMQSISLEQWVSLCWFNLIHMVISFLVVIHFTQVKIFFHIEFLHFQSIWPNVIDVMSFIHLVQFYLNHKVHLCSQFSIIYETCTRAWK